MSIEDIVTAANGLKESTNKEIATLASLVIALADALDRAQHPLAAEPAAPVTSV